MEQTTEIFLFLKRKKLWSSKGRNNSIMKSAQIGIMGYHHVIQWLQSRCAPCAKRKITFCVPLSLTQALETQLHQCSAGCLRSSVQHQSNPTNFNSCLCDTSRSPAVFNGNLPQETILLTTCKMGQRCLLTLI